MDKWLGGQMDREDFMTIHMSMEFSVIWHLLNYQSRPIMPFSLHPCLLSSEFNHTFARPSNATAGTCPS